KKGFNIYLYYWTIFFFFLFIILNYVSNDVKVEALDIGLMISVVSFLFGFLITITFSMLLTKVSKLKDFLAEETGRLVSLYSLSKNLGTRFHNKIVERIDQYTILTLGNYTNYEFSRDSFYGLYQDSDEMEIKTEFQRSSSSSFFYILGELEPVREKLEYLTNRRVEWPLKFTNYVLGFVLIALLFLNRGDTFTNSLFVILSTIIIFIFLIIEDFDSLKIGDYTYNISNSEQIFDLLGKDRYYPQEILSKVKLQKGRKYRIGFYDPKSREEKIVSLVYNPNFNSKLGSISKKYTG
ncbi:MAG: hypothetical protein AABX03_00345, partial [Nanoarchaeota archaeon]